MLQDLAVRKQGGSRDASQALALSGASCSERKREWKQRREKKGEEKTKKSREEAEDIDNRDSSLGSSFRRKHSTRSPSTGKAGGTASSVGFPFFNFHTDFLISIYYPYFDLVN